MKYRKMFKKKNAPAKPTTARTDHNPDLRTHQLFRNYRLRPQTSSCRYTRPKAASFGQVRIPRAENDRQGDSVQFFPPQLPQANTVFIGSCCITRCLGAVYHPRR